MKITSLRINDLNLIVSDPNRLLVDLRSPSEYAQKHLPSAINLPFEAWQDNPSALSQYHNRRIYLYCEHGNVSILAARILTEHGYNVVNLTGGIKSYRGCCLRSSRRSPNTT